MIKGLQEMKIAGFLTVRLESGKGGYHEIYRCPYTKQEIMAMVLSRVIDAFPDETASRVLASRVK